MMFSRTLMLGEGLGDLERAHHAGGADPVRRQAGDVVALEGDAAGIGLVEAGDGGEQRRLARAVGPDQADDLALRARRARPGRRP